MAVTLLLLSLVGWADEPIDWNDDELKWFSHEEGLALMKQTGQKGLLIIYADWCSTCKAYSNLFQQQKVVEALEGLVLMRANRDTAPEISQRFDFDGEYIPRTMALQQGGQVITDLYPEK